MTKFLKTFYLTLKEYFNNKDSSEVEAEKFVPSEEPIIRHVFSKSHCANNAVKWQAFSPNMKQGITTSVSRCQGWSCDEKKQNGIGVGIESNREIKARAELIVQSAMSVNLAVEISEPPIRHANIINWHQDKEDRKEQAMELVNEVYSHKIY